MAIYSDQQEYNVCKIVEFARYRQPFQLLRYSGCHTCSEGTMTDDKDLLQNFQVEIATLTRENGKTVVKILPNSIIDKECKIYEDEKAKEDAERKEKEKKMTPKKAKR